MFPLLPLIMVFMVYKLPCNFAAEITLFQMPPTFFMTMEISLKLDTVPKGSFKQKYIYIKYVWS